MKISKFVLVSLLAGSVSSFAQTLTHVEPSANNVDVEAAPTSIKLTVADSSGATLNKVEVSSDGGSNWADAPSLTGILADGQTVVVGGLTAATAYQFRIIYNGSTEGAAVSATTKNAILGTSTVNSVSYPFITVTQSTVHASGKFVDIHIIKSSDGSQELNKIDISAKNTTEVTANGWPDLYNDYTDETASPSSGLTAGTSYKYEVTFEKSDWNGANIWADWNRDGDFLDENELIGSVGSRSSIANAVFDFTVPAGLSDGDVVVRCRTFAGNGRATARSENEAWGYTANNTTTINDFKISVGTISSDTLTIDSATANTSGDKFTEIALAVTEGGSAEVERVEVSTNGGSSWNTATVANINATPIVVTSLTEGTSYDFRLVDTDPAVTSDVVSGSTAAYSLAIAGVTPVTGNETTQLALDITKDGTFSVVKVELSISGADVWSDATATDLQADPIVVTGLLPGNDYDFRVTYNTDVVSAVATGGTAVAITAVTGDVNDNVTLELNGGYLDTTISGVQGTGSRTVSAWIKTTDTNATIASWGDNMGNGLQMILLLDPSGLLRLEAGGGYKLVDSPALNDGEWHHVVFTFAGITMNDVKLFIDGVYVANVNNHTRAVNTLDRHKVRIGTDVNLTRKYSGSMDEIAIFSRAFSRNEIANIYNEGNGRGYFHQIKNDAGDTNLVNDSSLILYYDASAGITDNDPNPDTTPIVINAAGDTSTGTIVGDVVTPAKDVRVVQTGTKITWSVADQLGVLEYQVVNKATGDILEVVAVKDGQNEYNVTLDEYVEIKLIIIDIDGSKQTFSAKNGNQIDVEYKLAQGWNLIATVGTASDLSEVEATTIGTLWGWNGSNYVKADTDAAYAGLWVYAPKAATVDATATKGDSSVILSTGWNLAGPANNVDIPESVVGLYTWSQTYENVLEKYDLLYKGIGYWFFVENEITIDLK